MENKDWREEIRGEWSQEVDNEMPMVFIVDGEEQIAYWWLNKIEALLQSKQEEIEKVKFIISDGDIKREVVGLEDITNLLK